MPPVTSEYLYFSEDGLMWFSTSKGLTSFDGSEPIYYSNAQQAKDHWLTTISFIAEDDEHNFYITTAKKVIYYNRQSRSFTEITYSFKDNNISEETGGTALFIDRDKKVYIGTGMRGLFIYNPTTKHTEHLNLDTSKPDSWKDKWQNTVASFAVHTTDTNKLWIGTYHGIYLFDKRSKTFSQNFEIITPLYHKYLHQLPMQVDKQAITVEKIDVANDSTIWFNSWAGGFGHYNTRTGNVKLFFRDAVYKSKDKYYGYIIPRFARWRDGKYFLGIFDPHPGIYDPKTRRLDFVKLSPQENTIDEVRFVTNDRYGNLWLCSKGLIYAAMPDYLQMGHIPAKGQMRGVYFDNETKQYYTTPYGIYVYDTSFNEKQQLPVPLFNNYFTVNAPALLKITKDGSGRFWAAGLETYILLPGKKKFEYIEKTLPSLAWIKRKNEMTDVIGTKNGDILLASITGTVFIINHETLVTDTLTIPEEKNSNNTVSIQTRILHYDSSRHKLYTTNSISILQYDFATKGKRLIPAKELMGSAKTDSKEIDYGLDDEGRIWIWIPAYGVRIIEPASLTCVDSIKIETRGLIRGDFERIRYGGKNRMFFQSRNGIIIYDYEKQHSYILGKNNGLSSPAVMYMGYANNHLVIGQRYRIEYYNLDNLNKASLGLTAGLNTISADTTLVYSKGMNGDKETIHLKYFQNNLHFSFSATNFFFPERIEYAYQLTGIDKEWKYTNTLNRKIIYTNLWPGKYIFQLKAQIQGGNWQAETVEYTIVIQPAFWQTSWFKFLCILIAIVFIFYLGGKRIQSIRKREQQRIKQEKRLLELEAKALRAQMNPHFVFNSLNSIKSLIIKNENDKAAEYLTTFSKLIRTLFQNSDKREVSLHDELETCKLYTQIEKMRFGDKVDFLFEVDENIDLKDIKIPALILQPVIENAIWHGLVPKENGGKVIVSVKEKNGLVECIIDDNGIGRGLSRQYKSEYECTHESKGIGLTKSRLELDKLLNDREDTIRIIDKTDQYNKGEGTTVIITFKGNKI